MKNFYDLELANHFVPHQWLMHREIQREKLEKFTKLASIQCDVTLTFDFIFNAFKREEFYAKMRKSLIKINPDERKKVKCIVKKLKEINLTDLIDGWQLLDGDEAVLKASKFINKAKFKCQL